MALVRVLYRITTAGPETWYHQYAGTNNMVSDNSTSTVWGGAPSL